MLMNGPYIMTKKDPLNQYVKEYKSIVNVCGEVLNKKTIFQLTVSNPTIPKLYCLPKTHKPGNSYRPIVSNINSTTYNLSKWLINEFKILEFDVDFSIKNSIVLANKLKNVKLDKDDRFISFDIVSLFPNIPIPDTINILENLLEKNNISKQKIFEYIKLTNLCMRQNTFKFNNNYFQQTYGTAMGNPLSPFLANVFMNNFETNFKNSNPEFPKIWFRYVDDIFAIVNKSFDINAFMNKINNVYPSIKFTFELEIENKLPFLDLLLIRNETKINFGIYRKPTHINSYIHNDSCSPKLHKLSAFNSLLYRLENIPLSKEKYKEELNKILEIAVLNGYEQKLIFKLLRTQKNRKLLKLKTTLVADIGKKNKIYTSLTFHPEIEYKFKNLFKKYNIETAYNNNFKLKSLIKNTKDKEENINKSGIYKINCSNCNKCYIGQTKRNLLKRFKEHLYYIRYQQTEKSALACHNVETGHTISLEGSKLLKHSTAKNLNMLEAIYMKKFQNYLLNNDLSPLANNFLKIIETLP